MASSPSILSGAPRSSARSTRPSASSIRAGRPPSSSSASRASARPACSPSSPPAPTRAGILVLCGCAAELERDLPFWVFVDALDEYVAGLEPRRLGALDDDVVGRARARPPVAVRARRRRRWRSSTSATAATAPCASCSSCSPRRSRSCSCSTTCTGPTPASVELLGALLRRPPAAPVLLALAVRPRQVPRAARRRARARAPRGDAHPPRARRAHAAARPASCSATAVEPRWRPLSTRRAAATRSISSSSPGRSIARQGGARIARDRRSAAAEVPPTVAAALTEELALLSDRARRVLEGAAVAGDPFEPELAAAAAAAREPAALEALDELLRLDLVRHDRRPAALPLPAPARAPGGLRGDARRLAARRARALRRGARGTRRVGRRARPPRRALRTPGRRRRRRRPARGRRGGRAARAGERRALVRGRAAAPPETAPAEERVELLLALRRGAGRGRPVRRRATRRCSRRSSSCPRSRSRCASGSRGVRRGRAPPRAPRAGRTRAWRALWTSLPDQRSPEAVALMIELAVDGFWRTRIRGDARVGRARAERPPGRSATGR